ncbi:TRAP transporter substrate-binding protein [Propylenella binzhouense]
MVNLKLSTWVPPAHPLNPALQAWAASIEKASGGTIKSTLFPSEQLGKAFDHYDMARDGIADFTYVNPGYQPGRFPIFAAGQLPFLFSNGKGGSAALDEWYRAYAGKEMQDVHFCMAFVHDPGSLHSRVKIVVPSDISGKKIRPAGQTIAAMVTQLGGTNVQASAPESRDVLERGVADAIFFPWGSIMLFGIEKAVKYHIDAPLYTSPFVWVMNKDRYDGMSDAQKKVIDDHCTTEWAEKIATPWADFEHAGIEKLKAMSGHEVYPLTPEQVAEWRKATENLTMAWAEGVKSAGGDPDAALSALKESLARHDAAF